MNNGIAGIVLAFRIFLFLERAAPIARKKVVLCF